MVRLVRAIGLPYLRASRGRSALVAGGAAIGVALIVAIQVVNASALASFRRSIEEAAGPAALEVTLGTGEIGFAEDALEVVRADPEVLSAVPRVRGTLTLAGDADEALQLFGVDVMGGDGLERYRIAAVTDRRALGEALLDPRALLVTREFAAQRALRVGDVLAVSAPAGVTELRVRGLLEADGLARALAGRLAIMDLPAAQLVLAKPRRLDQVDVMLAPETDVEAVAARLRARLPATLSVERPAQRGALYDRILGSFQTMLTGLSLLCLVAGTYITYNTTSTGAVHRALAIAGLRVTGADRSQLFRLLVFEALLLGSIGTAVGIPAGVLLARLLAGLVTESMGVIFQLRFAFNELVLDPGPHLRIAALGIGATLFGSCFAARRVTALEPLEVLRADLRALSVRTSPRRLIGWWFALVAMTVVALVLEVRLKSAGWGNFGSTLWFASPIVIAVPLVTVAAPLLGRLMRRLFGPAGTMAADGLVRAPTRTGVTVAAIALVLTVGITFASMARSHHESVRGYLTGGMFASDLVVSAVATEGGWLESPVPPSVAAEIRAIAGVAGVETLRVLPGQLYRGQRIAVAGLSGGLFDPGRYPRGWYRKGDPRDAAAALRAGRGVVISTSFADRFATDVVAPITLDTPTGTLTLTVVGIAPEYASDRGSVLLSASLLASRWEDAALNWALVSVAEGTTVDTIRAAIARRLGERHRLKILTLEQVVQYINEKIDRAYAFTMAIQLLIVIVTVAGIFDLLVAAIAERRRELAVWRMIGADAALVRRAVTLESGAIGLLGSVLGIAVGLVTARIWVAIHYRYLIGYHLEHHFAAGSAAWYMALVMLMTVASGHAAARYATRQSILRGIQTS